LAVHKEPPLRFTRRAILLGANALIFAPRVISRTLNQVTINVADYGVRPKPGLDATAGLKLAINACPKSNAKILFPYGNYYFKQARGVVLSFDGFEEIEIDGGGSTFYFEGFVTPFSIRNTQRPYLHDFSIDWRRPPFSQGEIIAREQTTTIDVRMDDDFSIGPGGTPVVAVRTFDRSNGRPTFQAPTIHPIRDRTTLVAPRTIRLEYPAAVSEQVGNRVVLTHSRDCFGLLLSEVSDIKAHNIDIRTAPGMGCAGINTQGASFEDCRIAAPDQADRLMSTTADGFHFWSSRGTISVQNCVFSALGDDCINVHSFLLEVASIKDESTIVLANSNTFANHTVPIIHSHLPKLGDTIQLIEKTSLEVLLSAVVQDIDENLAAPMIRLSERIPANLKANSAYFAGDVPGLVVRDSEFTKSWQCGVVAHKNALIEGNRFSDLGWAGVNCQMDTFYKEGPATSDVVVRKNKFGHCAQSFNGYVRVSNQFADDLGRMSEPRSISNRRITVEDNDLLGPGRDLVSVSQADEVRISNNRFEGNPPRAELVKMNVVKRVNISKNRSDSPGIIRVMNSSSDSVEVDQKATRLDVLLN
jgi:hypothetical protein